MFDLIFNKKPAPKSGACAKPAQKRSTTRVETIDGIKINYKKHPFSKNIRIISRPAGDVLVTLPKSASFARAREFVLKNREWIKENVQKSAALGALGASGAKNLDVIEERRKLARKILPERLEYLAKKFGFKYGRVFVKNQKTVWGSCSYRNNINLNLNLVALDDEFIDYVILHELTHTVHKNHQKAFYDLLTKNMPNALEVQKKLKKIKLSSL